MFFIERHRLLILHVRVVVLLLESVDVRFQLRLVRKHLLVHLDRFLRDGEQQESNNYHQHQQRHPPHMNDAVDSVQKRTKLESNPAHPVRQTGIHDGV